MLYFQPQRSALCYSVYVGKMEKYFTLVGCLHCSLVEDLLPLSSLLRSPAWSTRASWGWSVVSKSRCLLGNCLVLQEAARVAWGPRMPFTRNEATSTSYRISVLFVKTRNSREYVNTLQTQNSAGFPMNVLSLLQDPIPETTLHLQKNAVPQKQPCSRQHSTA